MSFSLLLEKNVEPKVDTTGVASDDAKVEVHFDNHVQKLQHYLEVHRPHFVVGCMYTFTDEKVGASLKDIPAHIVIQKDSIYKVRHKSAKTKQHTKTKTKKDHIAAKLCAMYASLKPLPGRDQAVDCCGWSSSKHPLMHHKMLVFCNSLSVPFAVWTGSYNLTTRARISAETSIFITDNNSISQQFYNEYSAIAKHSENIQWKKKTPG